MDKTEEKFLKLTTQKLPALLLRLSAPAILSMLISAIYNAADAYFVSTVNDSAVGSIGVVFSFMAVIQAAGFMFGHGSGNYMSRELGKKNYEDSGKIAVTGTCLSFITGIIIMIPGLIFLRPLCRVLGSTETILPYAAEYLRCILIAAPFQCAALTLNNELRFQGNAKHGLLGLGLGAVLNMGLDPLFISVFGLGVTGAGLATMISQITGFTILMICTFRGGNMPMKLNRFTLSAAYIKEIISGGLPSFGRQAIGSLATILLNFSLKPYGDSAIAAMTVVSKVAMILMSVIIGCGQGFQPVCGMNYGAKKYSRVLGAFRYTVIISTLILVSGSALAFIFARPIISLFATQPLTVDIGVRGLRYQCISAGLGALYMIASMMLQNLGKSAAATLLAVSRQGLFFIPLILILPRLFGLTGALTAQPVADCLAFMFTLPLLLPVTKDLRNRMLTDAE